MTSEEMNKKIRDWDDKDDTLYKSCIGDKLIPYIGWFWRNVDFDATEGHSLGILPQYEGQMSIDRNDSPKIGFMENNKWDYDSIYLDTAQWKHLKELIITALEKMEPELFKVIDRYMQTFLPKDK